MKGICKLMWGDSFWVSLPYFKELAANALLVFVSLKSKDNCNFATSSEALSPKIHFHNVIL